jgi:hypothetical protein
MNNLKLFHGSTAEISQFVPRDGINAGIGKYVGTLATDVKKMAMLYAMKIKEGFNPTAIESALGAAKDVRGVDPKDFMLTNHVLNGVPCAVIRDRTKFLRELEKAGGGHLYTLPTESFAPVRKPDGTATTEWLSTSESVVPLKKEPVSLDQVLRAGCQVLFLRDGVDFNTIYTQHMREFDAGEKQIALYKRLIDEGVLTSENATRGISNPLRFGEQQATTTRWSDMPRNRIGYRPVIALGHPK